MNQILENKDKKPGEASVEGEIVKEENSKSINSQLIAKIESTYFSGPLPSPDTLRKYEKILPGSVNRIIRMAEDQSKHRRGLEKAVVGSNIFNERVGMVLGFITGIIVILASFFLIYIDKPIQGFLTLGLTIVAYAYSFKKQKNKEDVASKSSKDNKLRGDK